MSILAPVCQSILRPVAQSISAVLGTSGFSPTSLFPASEQGAWYDPSDFASMFTDSIGTTPVTAVGQVVGLLLDKRKGLVRGAETVTNGDFANGATGWTAGAGIAITDLATFTASNSILSTSTAMQAGKTYELTADIGFTSGGLQVRFGGASAGYSTGNAGKLRLIAASSGGLLEFVGTGLNATLDNISVKLLDGNHATQATTAATPLAETGGSEGLDGVDDYQNSTTGGAGTAGFFFCAGVKATGGAATARTIFGDAGTNAGYRVRINASNQLELAAGNGIAFTTIATVATVTVGTTYVITAWDDGTNLNVQVNSNAVASVARPVVTAGTAAITLGRDNGAATSYFTGSLFPCVYRQGSGLTAAQRTDTKNYVAGKCGVVL